MKQLNLDETWQLCLKMWKWIIKEFPKLPDPFHEKDIIETINDLKDEWCVKNGFEGKVDNSCFFCEYGCQHAPNVCGHCPAVKIDPEFDCMNTYYDYSKYPVAFYKKLKQLNKIRLKKKKGAK